MDRLCHLKKVLAALCASTALVTPCWAQNAGSETQPDQRQELDENGVNPATGKQINYATELSIGPSGPGGLRLIRARGAGISQSNLAYLMSGDPTTQVTVSAGLRSIIFNKLATIYEAADGSAATLVQDSSTQWTLTLEDGTIVIYKQQMPQDSYKARGTDVTYPTGEKLSLAYNTVTYCTSTAEPCPSFGYAVRLQSVSSSLGYQFHYTYGKDEILVPLNANGWKRLKTITAINTTVDPCAPLAGTCTTTQAWPTITIGATTDAVTDPVGNTTTYTDTITQFKIRRPSSAVDNVVVNFDANQRTTSVVRDGMTWNYSWTTGSNQLTMVRTDPLNHVLTVISDTVVGLPKSVTDELGRTTTHQYDASGRRYRTNFPEGNWVRYTYDGRGNVAQIRRVAKTGSGLADIVTSATYPTTCTNPKSCNNPDTTTDERGNVTDYTYNSNGDPLTVTRPAPVAGGVRPQTRYTYSNIVTPGGTFPQLQSVSQCQTLASCTGTADEAKTSFTWSNQLVLTGVTRANGTGTLSATTTITNDNVGNPKTIDGALAGTADTTTMRYDLARRVVGVISPDPDGAGALKQRAVRTDYHPDGGVSTVKRGTVNGTTDADWAAMTVLDTQTISYDAASRPSTVSITGSNGVVQALSQQSYDGEGRAECNAIRMNPSAYSSLPTSACTLGTQGSFGPDRISKIVYDAADQVTQKQVAVGTVDQANEQTFAYNANGTLQSLKDGENNLTTYIYDGHDRLSQTRYPNMPKGSGTSNAADYEQLGYDAASNVTSRRLRDGQSIAYSYDNLNRATLKDLPGTEPDVSFVYDNLNRPTSATKTGSAVSFTYDALSRNLTQTGPQGTVTSAWDLAGRRTQITYPGTGLYVNYDYLVTGETSAIRENGATSGVGVLATFGYDQLGNRTGISFGNGTSQAYSYDPVSRLSSLTANLTGTADDLTVSSINYDPASQIVGQTRSPDSYAWNGHYNENRPYTANGLNQYTLSGTIVPSYDARGNLTSAGSITYGYTSENMLSSASNGVSLSYDPLMRLSQVTGSTATTKFAYDGFNALVEYDGGNLMLRRYVFGPGMDQPLMQYEGSDTSTRRWLHADERRSIIAISDASGATFAKNSYDEYGIPGSYNYGRFQFTGQMWLPELGMYYYKARIYSPTFGRFMQTDPIGYGDGPNWYNYVGSDPINKVDPFGLGEDLVVTAPCASRYNGGRFESYDGNRGICYYTIKNRAFNIPSFVFSWRDRGQGPQNNQPKTCNPTPSQLANSGVVKFRFSEGSATLLATSGDAFGTFGTAAGYSGVFHTSFDGGFYGGKGFGAAYGTGSSQSLATFKGVNYNLIGTLGPYSFSDNFDPSSGAHVGQTDALSRLGVGLGITRSDTTLVITYCPR